MIVVTGIGAATMVNMKLVPNPADALAATIGDKLGKGMGLAKMFLMLLVFVRQESLDLYLQDIS